MVWALLSSSVLFACSGSEESDETTANHQIDSTSIVEYELDETRLSAVEYNDNLSLIQQRAYDQINQLFLSDPLTVEQNFENAKFDIDIKLADLKQMEVYEGGEDFKVALVDLLSFYQQELSTGFAEIVNILVKDPEQRTPEEVYHISTYDDDFATKEYVLFVKIDSVQTAFASVNNIQIINL